MEETECWGEVDLIVSYRARSGLSLGTASVTAEACNQLDARAKAPFRHRAFI